jgi:hypothetical protein
MPRFLLIPLCILVGVGTIEGIHAIGYVANPGLSGLFLGAAVGGIVAGLGINADRLGIGRVVAGMMCAAIGVGVGLWW